MMKGGDIMFPYPFKLYNSIGTFITSLPIAPFISNPITFTITAIIMKFFVTAISTLINNKSLCHYK